MTWTLIVFCWGSDSHLDQNQKKSLSFFFFSFCIVLNVVSPSTTKKILFPPCQAGPVNAAPLLRDCARCWRLRWAGETTKQRKTSQSVSDAKYEHFFQLSSSDSQQILPHFTIYPQNYSTRRVETFCLAEVFASQIRSVASGSPRVPRCEQTLRCDFTHYSQSGGGSQMEPVNYRCLNCRGVWTHTYTRALLYCLIGVKNDLSSSAGLEWAGMFFKH